MHRFLTTYNKPITVNGILLVNLALIIQFYTHQISFFQIVFIFLIQAFFAYIENIIRIIITPSSEPLIVNGKPVNPTLIVRITICLFFTFHYLLFIFIFGGISVGIASKFDTVRMGSNYLNYVLIFALLLLSLPGKINNAKQYAHNLFLIMFMPYLRLIPFAIVFITIGKTIPAWVVVPLFFLFKTGTELVYYYYFELKNK